jgi:2-methylcitrate dehydratase PrpD
MNSLAESTIIERLAANVLETRFENLDWADLEHARNRIIDVVGCLIGGANAPGNSGLVDLVRDWGGKEEATILIHGGKAPAHNVALVNSIMCRSFDFEPVSPTVEGRSAPGHVSGSTVTTTITMGEVRDINGKELLTTLLVGDDVTSRVLLAGSGSGLSPGWDRIGPINPFGTTAIAGRLLGLNKFQMRNAFGIVLNLIAGTFDIIQDTTTSFKLTQGTAAKSGIFSAELARAGWTGPKDALFGKFGYYHLYTEGCRDPSILTRDLGKKFYSDGVIKPYSCCRGCHGAVDCALAFVHKHGVEARDIQEAIFYVSSGYSDNILALPFRIGDFSHANAIFSIQYCGATALLKKSVKPEHFTEEAIRDPQINAFIKKVRVTAELSQAEEQNVKLKVIMKDGRELTEHVDVPKGDQLGNPISKDEIIAKFWTNVEFSRTVTRENAERLLALLEKLEDLDSVKRIVELLVV